MCQEKKDKEGAPALWIALVHQHKDSRTKFQSKDRLITGASNSNSNIITNRKATKKQK